LSIAFDKSGPAGERHLKAFDDFYERFPQRRRSCLRHRHTPALGTRVTVLTATARAT
jgi:hypothetical protein